MRGFEFAQGHTRYRIGAVASGRVLEPAEAAALLERQLRADPWLHRSLAAWVVADAVGLGVAAHGDRTALVAALLRKIRLGAVRVAVVGAQPLPAYGHQRQQAAAVEPGPPPLDDIVEASLEFEVIVVDELGEAIAGVELEWSHAGERARATTAGDGAARLRPGAGPGRASVRFTDLDAVRELVGPRWDSADRSGERLEPEPDLSVVMLDASLAPRSFEVYAARSLRISVRQPVELLRLFGPSFEPGRSFVLPSALESLVELRRRIAGAPERAWVVVGHCERGEADAERLSRERAELVCAWLGNDVDRWIEQFDDDGARGWSTREDALMLAGVRERPAKPGESQVLAFQRWFNEQRWLGRLSGDALAQDGVLGRKTRAALIDAYQRRGDLVLGDDVQMQAHGDADRHPLASKREDDPVDQRRIELFGFDGALGVQPELGAKAQPAWLARATTIVDLHGRARARLPVIPLEVAGFARGSAFVHPGLAAGLEPLRELVADELAQVVVFGHSDPSGSGADNKRLAERRAAAVRALLCSDAEALHALAQAEGWGIAEYQAMLRGLAFVPGAIDDEIGPMTKAAIAAFVDAHAEGWLTGPAPSPGDSLDAATKRAIVFAYVDEFGLGLAPERLLGSDASGCREYNNIDVDAPRQRRVTLAVFRDPAHAPGSFEFPCVAGDSGACTLDSEQGMRCRFYRSVALPLPRVAPPRWFEFAWQRTPSGKVHISALTTALDSDEVEIEIGIADGGLPRELPSSAAGGGELALRDMDRLPGLVRAGVSYALWDAERFDPFDPRQWFSVDPEAEEIEGLPVPTFIVRLGQHWAVATPPGRRLDRIALSGEVDREIVALLSDGSFARFSGRAGLQEADQAGLHVLAIYPWDGLAEAET